MLPTGASPTVIRRLRPLAKIAVHSSHSYPELLRRTRELRLSGFILKQDGVDEFHYALRTILGGGFYVPPSMSNLLLDPENRVDPLGRLTERERAVASLYAQGKTLPQIAGLLQISVKTAETHRSNLGRKLGHPNRSQLTAFALTHHPSLAGRRGGAILALSGRPV